MKKEKNIKSGALSDEKIKLFEELGVILDSAKYLDLVRDNKWMALYEQLKEYKEKYGNCDVPARWGSLGIWAKITTKTAYKKGKLSEKRIHLLNELGFKWNNEENSVPDQDEKNLIASSPKCKKLKISESLKSDDPHHCQEELDLDSLNGEPPSIELVHSLPMTTSSTSSEYTKPLKKKRKRIQDLL